MKTIEKEFNKHDFYQVLKDKNLILFEAVIGSQAYGTATPESDIDKKFVFILPEDDILGMGYIEQLTLTDDYVGYEIKRFLELLQTNNPTILELLNVPEDCIEISHPAFAPILENKERFITKLCKNSFGGYARQQLYKAKGQDKKMNWEKARFTRKSPIDFCYSIIGNNTIPLVKFLESIGADQKFCGVVKISNAKDLYGLYYDAVGELSQNLNVEKREFLGYKGIQKVDRNGNFSSNSIRLSSVPKDAN